MNMDIRRIWRVQCNEILIPSWQCFAHEKQSDKNVSIKCDIHASQIWLWLVIKMLKWKQIFLLFAKWNIHLERTNRYRSLGEWYNNCQQNILFHALTYNAMRGPVHLYTQLLLLFIYVLMKQKRKKRRQKRTILRLLCVYKINKYTK